MNGNSNIIFIGDKPRSLKYYSIVKNPEIKSIKQTVLVI